MEHRLTVSKRQLGRGAIKGSAMMYGTAAKCSCGEWHNTTNNYPPSRGGKSWAEQAHANHLASTTREGDIATLTKMLARAQQKLVEATEFGLPSFIESWSTKVAELEAQLAAERWEADA